MPLDNAFIRKWEPEYDRISSDEDDYQQIVSAVRGEASTIGTLSKDTLKRIYSWKAPRAKGYVKWGTYNEYATNIRSALVAPSYQNMRILDNLPGVGVPIASTILHFVRPDKFPIVDFRTVEALLNLGELPKSKGRNYYRFTIPGYQVFHNAVLKVYCRYPTWSLRQIDRALSAYHKSMLDPKRCT